MIRQLIPVILGVILAYFYIERRKSVAETVLHEWSPRVSQVPVVMWNAERPLDIEQLFLGRTPIVVRNSSVTHWHAVSRWSPAYLAKQMPELNDVMLSQKKAGSFLHVDEESSLYRAASADKVFGVDLETPHTVINMTTHQYFDLGGKTLHRHRYYYGNLPQSLLDDISTPLGEAQHTFLWLSSARVSPAWHWDSDHNLFAQIKGRKNFRFISPTYSLLMRPYPRIHPSWHKGHTPTSDEIHMYQIELQPGDLLYSPPYWWHSPVALDEHTASIACWTRLGAFDKLKPLYQDLQRFEEDGGVILKSHLTQLIYQLYNQPLEAYFDLLLEFRWKHLHLSYPKRQPLQCPKTTKKSDEEAQSETRMAVSLLMHVGQPDQDSASQYIAAVRDLELADYVERAIAATVGAHRVEEFLQKC